MKIRGVFLALLTLALIEYQAFSMSAPKIDNKKTTHIPASLINTSQIEKKKINNRKAARKYRKKKALASQTLLDNLEVLKKKNIALQNEIIALQSTRLVVEENDSTSFQNADLESLYLKVLNENSQLSKKNSRCLEEIQRLRDEVRRLSELAL